MIYDAQKKLDTLIKKSYAKVSYICFSFFFATSSRAEDERKQHDDELEVEESRAEAERKRHDDEFAA